jgi:hypothetical protein
MSAHLAVLAPSDLSDPNVAAEVLSTIISAHSDLVPRRFGSHEPLRSRANPQVTADELVASWRTPFLWTTGRRCEGSMWFDNPPVHDVVYLRTVAARAVDALVPLLRRLSLLTDAAYASLHVHYETEERYLHRYAAAYPYSIGPTTHDLRLSLPDMPWTTMFGAPYVAMFGRDCLTAAPAYRVEWLAPDLCFLQLTEAPPAPGPSSAPYEAARDAMKAHLGTEHFLDLTGRRLAESLPRGPVPLLRHGGSTRP